jgi:hypothetical protein
MSTGYDIVGSDDSNGKVGLIAALVACSKVFGGAVAVENGMAIKAKQAILILLGRSIAADKEDCIGKWGCNIRTALGVHFRYRADSVVPSELPNEPTV